MTEAHQYSSHHHNPFITHLIRSASIVLKMAKVDKVSRKLINSIEWNQSLKNYKEFVYTSSSIMKWNQIVYICSTILLFTMITIANSALVTTTTTFINNDNNTTTTTTTTTNATTSTTTNTTSIPMTTTPPSFDETLCLSNECIQIAGKMWDSMNDKADPCEDFYEFVCGKYLQSPMPGGVDSWGHFSDNQNKVRINLVGTLKNEKVFEKKPAAFRNLYSFYKGCINTTLRNEIGYEKLFMLIKELGGWPLLEGTEWDRLHSATFNWEDAFLHLALQNLFFLIKIEGVINLRNTSEIIIKIGPPYKTKENIINLYSLAMNVEHYHRHYSFHGQRMANIKSHSPSDDNALKAKAKTQELYRKVIDELSKSKQYNHTKPDERLLTEDIDAILKLHSELEKRAAPIKPMSYYQNHYEEHLYTAEDIHSLIDLDIITLVQRFLPLDTNVKFNNSKHFFVPDIDYFKQIAPLIKTTSKRTLANYFVTNAVFNFAPHTTTNMIEMLVTKLDKPEVIENLCFEETALYLPELLGKLYVDSVFNNVLNDNLTFVVQAVHKSFHKLLDSSWMDEKTKKEALDKLDSMLINTGYPEWFNDKEFLEYCSMFDSITQDDYFTSVLMANEAGFTIDMSIFSEKFKTNGNASFIKSWPRKQIIDVNAFYYFNTNGIYIPAGILQYPFYSKDVPLSVVFGSLGMIVGHEMTHAFDNSGRLYDKNGALRDWWTKKTLERFAEKSDCFIEQYSSMKFENFQVNGNRTVAENIADNAGLHEAYQAFKMYENEQGVGQRLPGFMSKFNPDELFFISFANMWCTQINPDAVYDEIMNNVHSPSLIRVHGTLANSPDFARVFGCKNNTRMNPVEKCFIY